MSPRFLSILVVLLLLAWPPLRALEPDTPCNDLVLEAVRSMPAGGGYSSGALASRALQHAVSIRGDLLEVDASHAMPSYCSGATYLVFLKVISSLQTRRASFITPKLLASLQPSGQPDGTGIWGRWNANGPGTARLFTETNLGLNFTDPAIARPGDFLKIFWSDSIGASEHGHSVIFLGTGNRGGIPCLTYWSSNIPGGFGEKTVPLSRIHQLLFSRLERPWNFARFTSLPRSDHYLSSLQERSSTPSEMALMCGLAR